MPLSIIKTFAQKSNKSEKDIEDLYIKAKLAVDDGYPDVEKDSDKYFQLVTGILKKMLKLDEEISVGDVATPPTGRGRMLRRHPDGCPIFDCTDDAFWNFHMQDRGKGQWHMKHYQDHSELVGWGKANPGKPFYLQHEGTGMVRKINYK